MRPLAFVLGGLVELVAGWRRAPAPPDRLGGPFPACRASHHGACAGAQRDRGDGTWVRCGCWCHA